MPENIASCTRSKGFHTGGVKKYSEEPASHAKASLNFTPYFWEKGYVIVGRQNLKGSSKPKPQVSKMSPLLGSYM